MPLFGWVAAEASAALNAGELHRTYVTAARCFFFAITAHLVL